MINCSLGGAKRRVDQHERPTTSEPLSVPPNTRMVEPQGILLRLRRLRPHTKPQPRRKRAREAGDSREPGADEPPLRDHSTREVCTKAPARPQSPNQQKRIRVTARPAPSTRNRLPGQPTRPGTTRRKPQHPEKPHLPHPLPPAVKSKCSVSLSRGSVRFERGGPHTV